MKRIIPIDLFSTISFGGITFPHQFTSRSLTLLKLSNIVFTFHLKTIIVIPGNSFHFQLDEYNK